MSELRLRLTAAADDASRIATRLASLEGIESAEEVADLMPHMDDPDSSSAGLPDDMGPGTHLILVRAEDEACAQRALERAQDDARRLGIALEVEAPSR